MRPEDIDDLFKKKLGDFQPTPSADAWQRLQEQLQPQPKKRVIPMWWSVAATLAFLILTGTYFYYNQLQAPDAATMAQVVAPRPDEQVASQPINAGETGSAQLQDKAPTTEPGEEAGLLAQAERKQSPSEPAVPISQPTVADRALAQATPTVPVRKPVRKQTLRPAGPVTALPETGQLALREPATLPVPAIPAGNLEVMEVVILKDEPAALALAPTDGSEEDLEQTSVKGRVVKGLLNQVRNLTSGGKVELPSLNPNNYSIAFETHIGNRKISKTINF